MPSNSNRPLVVVAGHICLDVIPTIGERAGRFDELLVPGRLIEVGPPVVSAGGAVANTGIALHRLGIYARLIGKVGDDLFGHAILAALREQGEELADGMLVAGGETTSYTIVLDPLGLDRLFLHCPGVNETLRPEEIPLERTVGARFFHFAYPTLLRRTFVDGGATLIELFSRLRTAGTAVSIDMTWPDEESESGRIDWQAWLEHVLPHVDVFAPSLVELLYIFDRPRFDRFEAGGGTDRLLAQLDESLLHELGAWVLELGAPVLALKLGKTGFYLRTTRRSDALELVLGRDGGNIGAWIGRELYHPGFLVEVAGTTGAGDAAVAGLLAAMAANEPPEEVVAFAAAVGACSVEAPGAISGIPSRAAVRQRIRSGWKLRPMALDLPGWHRDAGGVWHSPDDASGTSGANAAAGG